MHQMRLLRCASIALLISCFLNSLAHAQLRRYIEVNVSGGAEIEEAALSRLENFTEDDPETSIFLGGTYVPAPNTYEMGYSASVGSGVAASFTAFVERRGATTQNTADLSVFTRSQDQVRFVSTGGSGTISATFELLYAFGANRAFPVASIDAEVDVSSTVRIQGRNGGNGGPILWDFRADRTLQERFGDTDPFDSLTTQGSNLYTGTFSENQLVTFDLISTARFDVTAADADLDVSAFLVLRSITDGFALETSSGLNYSQIPEPASAVLLAGMVGLAGAVMRRRGRVS